MQFQQTAGRSTRSVKRTESRAVERASEFRAGYKPVAVTGISEGRLVTIQPEMFSRLDVDPAYQRGETMMVLQIVRAIQAGGVILDPVTLCKRKGSDTLWIIDGHQRVCAFQQLGKPFNAMLHESESAESEHLFFLAMNSKRAINANVIVKAWTGPSGTVMRKANESLAHPLYNRLNFSQSNSESKLSASSVANAMRYVVGVGASAGRMEVVLSRIDLAMSKRATYAYAEAFLRLLGEVCPTGSLPVLVMRAISIVAHEYWKDGIVMPKPAVFKRLGEKKWAADLIIAEKYMPIIINAVKKIWKPAS